MPRLLPAATMPSASPRRPENQAVTTVECATGRDAPPVAPRSKNKAYQVHTFSSAGPLTCRLLQMRVTRVRSGSLVHTE